MFNFNVKKVTNSFPGFSKYDSLSPWLCLRVTHLTKAISVSRPILRMYSEIENTGKKKRLGGRGGTENIPYLKSSGMVMQYTTHKISQTFKSGLQPFFYMSLVNILAKKTY